MQNRTEPNRIEPNRTDQNRTEKMKWSCTKYRWAYDLIMWIWVYQILEKQQMIKIKNNYAIIYIYNYTCNAYTYMSCSINYNTKKIEIRVVLDRTWNGITVWNGGTMGPENRNWNRRFKSSVSAFKFKNCI